jgi:hypothetical protein
MRVGDFRSLGNLKIDATGPTMIKIPRWSWTSRTRDERSRQMGVAQPCSLGGKRGAARLYSSGADVTFKSRVSVALRLDFGRVFYELPPSRGTTTPKTADKKETGPHRFAHQLQMEKGNRV